jgi:hypothetical protein
MFLCALFILLILQTCPALIQESYTCTATFADAGRRTPLSSNVIRHFENETVSNQNSNMFVWRWLWWGGRRAIRRFHTRSTQPVTSHLCCRCHTAATAAAAAKPLPQHALRNDKLFFIRITSIHFSGFPILKHFRHLDTFSPRFFLFIKSRFTHWTHSS